MTTRTIRVLCVDDHAFLTEGLKTRLSLERDIEFVGAVGSAAGLRKEVDRLSPDVMIMDIEMPGPDPFEVLADVSRARPELRTIMLSAYVKDHYIDLAFKAGAWGYLSKSEDPDAVVEAIRTVSKGEFAFGPEVLERCQPTVRGRSATAPSTAQPTTKLDLLTPKELQVLRMIGKGLSRAEIAKATHRSPKTIDNHRAAIMEKLDIHDRVELVRYAIRERLVDA